MPPKIKVHEQFLRDLQKELMDIRNQIQAVREGINPNDPNHPQGFPLNAIKVRAGGSSGTEEGPSTGNFPAGQSVQTRVSSIGQKVNGKLEGQDKTLSRYAQGLGQLITNSGAAEQNNLFTTPSFTPPNLP